MEGSDETTSLPAPSSRLGTDEVGRGGALQDVHAVQEGRRLVSPWAWRLRRDATTAPEPRPHVRLEIRPLLPESVRAHTYERARPLPGGLTGSIPRRPRDR